MNDPYREEALNFATRHLVPQLADIMRDRSAFEHEVNELESKIDRAKAELRAVDLTLEKFIGDISSEYDAANRATRMVILRKLACEGLAAVNKPAPIAQATPTLISVAAMCDYLQDELKMAPSVIVELLTEYGLEECVWCRESNSLDKPSAYMKKPDQMSNAHDDDLGGRLCLDCAAAAMEEERRRQEETQAQDQLQEGAGQ